MTETSDTPIERLRDLSTAYWKSQALFTALRLNLFKEIGEGNVSLGSLSQRLGTKPDALERLLLSLAALGLLQQTEEGYAVVEGFRPYLSSGGENDFSAAITHMDHLQANWLRLDESVRTGEAVAFDTEIPESEIKEKTERFMAAMESIASTVADEMIRQFPLQGDETFLDLGCGPGTFFRRFLKKYPEVKATAVDTDDVIPITKRHVEQEGIEDRVTFLPGDLREIPFKDGDFHVVLLSNVMHIYPPDEAMKICEKAYRTLRPGGHFLVSEFFTDDVGTKPAWGTLFSLNMLLNTTGGKNYRLKEGEELLRKAGFDELQAKPLSSESTLLVGRKPGVS